MGIDIYLGWKNQTQEEKDARITGYSINHGHVGYLRASYGMAKECDLLGKIFNKKWDKDQKYDFEKNRKRVWGLLHDFLGIVVQNHNSEEIRYGIMWINSVYNFWELAISKQKEKKNPEVHISY